MQYWENEIYELNYIVLIRGPLFREIYSECKLLVNEIPDLYNVFGKYLRSDLIESLEDILYSNIVFDYKTFFTK